MKLKLTYSEFMALYGLFNHQIIGHPHINVHARLMYSLLMGVYKKLHAKSIERKKKYSIELKEAEALAFWIYFNQCYILPAEMIYEANLIDTINNSIHQKMMSTC